MHKEKMDHDNVNLLKMCRNNESLNFFQVVIDFDSGHLHLKTLANSFSALIKAIFIIVNKNGPLFAGFLRHNYILVVQRHAENP